MSFELRRNRIESLKKWKCVKVHDLITSFKIPDDSLEQLKNAVKNYISKAMLISFTELGEYDKQRAGDLKISICSYKQLPNLSDHLLRWIN